MKYLYIDVNNEGLFTSSILDFDKGFIISDLKEAKKNDDAKE